MAQSGRKIDIKHQTFTRYRSASIWFHQHVGYIASELLSIRFLYYCPSISCIVSCTQWIFHWSHVIVTEEYRRSTGTLALPLYIWFWSLSLMYALVFLASDVFSMHVDDFSKLTCSRGRWESCLISYHYRSRVGIYTCQMRGLYFAASK